MRFKEGDKVVVKGLDMAFVVVCYLEDNLVKLFVEGESLHTMHQVIHARPGVLLPNNKETLISQGWYYKVPADGSFPASDAPPRHPMPHDFDTIVGKFRKEELNINDWHWCTHSEGNGVFGAYIMGEGSEQCLASKHAFGTKQEVIDFYKSLGVNEKWIIPI